MSALSNLTQTSGTSTTTLPSWYCTAQQNIVSQATQAGQNAPAFANTVGQQAVNTLQQPNNAFQQATGTLGSIASGAANPWITGACGAVTPNTCTALGGLFSAQQNELNQLLPNITAPANAAGIGSGNFGSLRGQTAVDTARANAQAKLAAEQMCAALKNQATGVNAAIGQGNVAQAGITNAVNVGKEQMVSPFTNIANMANVIGSVNAPKTVSTTQTPSTLQSIGGVGALICGGVNGTSNLLYGSPGKGTPGQPGYVPPTGGLLGTGGGSLVCNLKKTFGSCKPTGGGNLPGGCCIGCQYCTPAGGCNPLCGMGCYGCQYCTGCYAVAQTCGGDYSCMGCYGGYFA